MNYIAKAIHHPGTVEVEASRGFMLKGIKTGPLAEELGGLGRGMAADGLEKRMAGGDPLEAVFFGRIAVGGTAGIPVRQGGQLPIRVAFIAVQS